MNETKRTGVVRLSDVALPATVTLTLTPNPPRQTLRQQVEVEFHEKAPANHTLVIAGEMAFEESGGAVHTLQYSGTGWTLRNPEAFLG